MPDHRHEMTDFSPGMLKGFLRVRVKMGFYEKAYPNQPGGKKADPDKLERAVKGLFRKQTGVSAEEFENAWEGRKITVQTRVALWRALGVSPSRHGVELIGWDGQREMPHAHAA